MRCTSVSHPAEHTVKSHKAEKDNEEPETTRKCCLFSAVIVSSGNSSHYCKFEILLLVCGVES